MKQKNLENQTKPCANQNLIKMGVCLNRSHFSGELLMKLLLFFPSFFYQSCSLELVSSGFLEQYLNAHVANE